MQEKLDFDIVILGRVLKLASPHKRILIAVVLIAILIAPVANIQPYLISSMVDDYIFKNDLEGLKFMAILYFAIILVNVVLQYAFIYLAALVGQSVIKDLRTRTFDHITNLKLKFFDSTPIGKITTRTINDIEAINNIFAQGVLTMIADILGIFAVLGIMFYTSWRLTLICLFTVPFMIIATYIFKEKVKKAFLRVRNEISTMNAFIQEQITGMQVVQIFNAEKQEMEKFKKINRRYTQANLDSIEYYAVFYPVVEFISAIAMALLVWWGSKGIWNETISVGAFVSFPIFLNLLFRPIRMLADKFNTLQMGLVAADRVFKVLDNNTIIPDYGDIERSSLKGLVEFDNVSFAYDGRNNVLHNINFRIEPGQTLAIVGSTGSGKTTLINILNRFYDINHGSIRVDDLDIKKYKLENLRNHIAIVLQDVFLFNGTVLENITLRDKLISREKVIEASKKIGAHRYIVDLPGGYDFMITERGSNLSMGQRQLISFVRALVFNPEILILDEATSSIDSETEAIIQEAIERLIADRTSIIIAHRLSTVRHADNIIVLDKGRLVEQGHHSDLIKNKDGKYRMLYERQFAEVV